MTPWRFGIPMYAALAAVGALLHGMPWVLYTAPLFLLPWVGYRILDREARTRG